REDITVQVDDGTVSLDGAVDNSWEAERAREIAGRVLGVQTVRSDLALDGEALPRETAPYSAYDYGYTAANDFEVPLYASPTQRNTTTPAPPDDIIRSQIIEELRWEPAIDLDEIDVQVEDARAEISGRVATWRLSRIAMANAYEGGARDVDVSALVVE
ncbi:MAG: BON domain-containing protein, partial [Planctomycetota bacterium]